MRKKMLLQDGQLQKKLHYQTDKPMRGTKERADEIYRGTLQ